MANYQKTEAGSLKRAVVSLIVPKKVEMGTLLFGMVVIVKVHSVFKKWIIQSEVDKKTSH